jgi:PAS domain S-box-containing protein
MTMLQPLVKITTDSSLKQVMFLLRQKFSNLKDFECAVVMEQGNLVGIVTEGDLLKWLAQGFLDGETSCIKDIMSHPVITLPESQVRDVSRILNLFRTHQISYLPVTNEDGNPVGYISYHAMFEVLGSMFETNSLELSKKAQLENQLRQTQTQLRKNQTSLQEAQEIANLGIWEYDLQTDKITWSSQIYRIFGFEPKEIDITYTKLTDYIHPEDRERRSQFIRRAIELGEPFAIDLQIIREDGSTGYIFSKGKPILNQNGKVIRLTGTVMDITERKLREKQIEQQLQELTLWRNRYEIAGQASGQILYEYNFSQDCILWGANTDNILDYNREEMPVHRDDYVKLVHPEDRAFVLSSMLSSFNTLTPFHLEYRLQKKDGSYLWIEDRNQFVFNRQKEVVSVIGMVADLSTAKRYEAERKETEIALRESEQRFRQLAENIEQVFYLTDINTNQILYIGSNYEKIWERSCQDLLDHPQSYIETIHPDDRDMVNDAYTQHLRDQLPYRTIHRLLSEMNTLQQVILDSTDLAIISTDLEGLIKTFNRGAEKMLGYSAEEVIGKCTPDLFLDPEENQAIARNLSLELGLEIEGTVKDINLKAQKILREEERTRIRKDGSRFPVRLSVNPLRNEQQQIIGFLGISRDITLQKESDRQRQEAEAALRKSEMRFRRVFESNVVGMMFTSHDGLVTSANDRFLEMIGYTREDLETGQINWGNMTPPEYAQIDQIAITNLNRDLVTAPWEKEYYRKDGSRVAVVVGVAMLSQSDGTRVVVVTDITDRQQAEQALKAENAFREQILENMTEGLCVCQEITDFPYVRFTMWNPQMIKITGYTMEQINQLGWYQSLYPDPQLQQRAKERMGRMRFGDNLKAESWEIIRADGQKRIISISTSLIIKPTNEVYVLALIQDITERQQMIDELRLSEERFRRYFEQSLIGMAITSPDKGWIDTNERLSEILGYSHEELCSMTWTEMTYPEDLAPDLANFNRVLAGEIDGYEMDKRFIHQDGHIIYAQISLKCLRKSDGSIDFFVAMVQDTSDRHWSEQALKESETRYRHIVETANEGIWMIDGDGKTTFVNQSLANMFGVFPDVMLGKTMFEFMDESAQREARQLFARRQAGIQEQHDFRFKRTDGTDLWAIVSSSPIFDQFGQFIGALGMITDISDRKKAEQALKESETSYRRIVETANEGIWVIDAEGKTIFANQKMAEMLKIPLDQLIGKTPLDFIAHNPQEVSDLIDRRKQGISEQTEKYLKCADASEIWVLVSNSPIFDESGQYIGALAMVTDITYRKQAEDKLQESYQKLAQTNEELIRATRLKDEFLANMSHELRTPLNAILGMCEILQEEAFGPINKQQQKALSTIERSGNHLLALINDILDLAKIEAGKIELDCSLVTIEYLCESSITIIKQQAFQKQIELKVDITPNLPSLMVDERRIRQVLLNLLNNAVKFTNSQGKVTLTVTQERAWGPSPYEGNVIRFAIKDTGIGIAPENLAKLFQPFSQVDSALNRQYSGTGLGLSLVKRIVEMHGGKVSVESELGMGSCFMFELPCPDLPPSPQQSPELSQDQPEPEKLTSSAKTPKTQPLILLAEDNEANVLSISSYLTAKGFRMIFAQNGQEAMELAQKEHPDLILMDISMPKVDGLQAITQIRKDEGTANIPIIALTALAMTGDRERCLSAGANEYLRKPVRFKELVSLIEQLI